MNLSSKLLKYLEGMRVVELLHDDERAIFSLFGLSFDITAETVLEQQEEFKRDLLLGIIKELLDYDVDEMSNPQNYTGNKQCSGKGNHYPESFFRSGNTLLLLR